MKNTLRLLLILSFVYVLPANAQTLREKIGQMIMTGFISGGESFDTLLTDLSERNLGGVILFGQNIESPGQLKGLNDSLKAFASTPVFIAVDQEGGIVARLNHKNGWARTSSAQDLGEESVEATAEQAELMAGWLYEAGFNIDLAPVVDMNVNPISPAIGNLARAYADDAQTVFDHSNAFINEMHQKNIMTAVKHFPGHGSAMHDSHLGFTDVTETWADSELIPYSKLIETGYSDFVMTGHLFNSNLDPDYPSSLSKIMVDSLLRGELGFKGLVITDELFMNAIDENFGFEEAIELAINAGTDVLLYRINVYEETSLVERVINTVEQKVNEGTIPESRIDESYARIIDIKTRYGLISNMEESNPVVPSVYTIANYPNPFNPATNIVFELPERAPLSVKIYNITGEEIFSENFGSVAPGRFSFKFNGSSLASGMYIVRANAGGKLLTHKIMMMK